MNGNGHLYKVAGLNVMSDIALPGLPTGKGIADVAFSRKAGDVDMPQALKPLILGRRHDGETTLVHFLTSSGYYIRFESTKFVVEMKESIEVHCYDDDASPEQLWGLFVSDVVQHILAEKGVDVLHASAISLDGDGVALIGLPGSGKSTLAAYLLKSGFPLLADDQLPIVMGQEGFLGIPNFPGMRLSEDTGRLLFGDIFEDLPVIQNGDGKRLLFFGSNNEDGLAFQAAPVPLKRIYILESGEDGANINPIPQKEAFFRLFPHIFDGKKPMEKLFHDRGKVVNSIPVSILSFPHDIEILPYMLEIIKNDCQAGSSGRGETASQEPIYASFIA